MSLIEEPRFVEVFKSRTSDFAVGYLDEIPHRDGDVCLSQDMKTWRPLAAGGFGGSSVNHTVTCSDPEADATMTFTRVEGTLWWNGNALDRIENPESLRPSIRPLPLVRRSEYLFSFSNELGSFVIYVSANKYNYSYESFKFFIGTFGGEFREIPIRQVKRMRDGGTTYIHTTEGTLYSPSKFGHVEKTATWKGPEGHKLVEYEPSSFLISEIDGKVQISSANERKP